MALADWQIERDVKITPFQKDQVSEGVLSSGLGSYGYDMRCGYKFRVFTNTWSQVVDPKNFDPKAFVEIDVNAYPYPPTKFILIPPNSFALAESLEYFEIPRDVVGVVCNKSTYARCGILTPTTILEPEWRGTVTLEITNTTPLPARVYAGEGIAQVLFFRSDGWREVYANALRYLMKKETPRDHKFENLIHPDEATCRVSYADRKGKYNDQKGITNPFVKKE